MRMTPPPGSNSHQPSSCSHMAALLYKPLISLRGEFAILVGRWRKTGTVIFFDIRPTPSAHREPPLGEISGNIMDFHFFRFLIVFNSITYLLYLDMYKRRIFYLDVYIAKKASSIIFSLIWHTVRSYDEIAI